MLGAMGGGDGVAHKNAHKNVQDEASMPKACPANVSANSESKLPMQSWTLWWLIRTYLQSLGHVLHKNIFAFDLT